MAEGFIKLHRRITKWSWYQDANTMRVFIHILLMANHEHNIWRGIDIERGQFLTSRASLAKELNMSDQAVRTALNHLVATKEITIQSTKKYTLITVENYEFFQGAKNKSTKKVTKRSTKCQPSNPLNSNQVNNQLSNQVEKSENRCKQMDCENAKSKSNQVSNQVNNQVIPQTLTTNKNIKNIKNKEKGDNNNNKPNNARARGEEHTPSPSRFDYLNKEGLI